MPDASRPVVARTGVAHLETRIQFGATFIEPVGFPMDRRMHRGIKQRAERDRARSGASGSPAPA
jgi:hypothetical protein